MKRLFWVMCVMLLLCCGCGAEGESKQTGTNTGAQKQLEKDASGEQKSEAGEAKSGDKQPTLPEESKDKGHSEKEENPPAAQEGISLLDIGYREYKDYVYGDIDVEVSYVVPFLTGKDAEKYPRLQAALTQFGEEKKQHVDGIKQELIASAKEMSEQMGTDNEYEMYFTDNRSATIMRADSRVTSVYFYNDSYWGGAHGSYAHVGATFDTQTGKELSLADVVSDIPAFVTLLKEKLQTEYASDYEYMYGVEEFMAELTVNPQIDWSMNSESITVYFNVYILGSYAMGAQIITIYFDEAPELFNAYYTETAPEYVLPVLLSTENWMLDVDGDGVREEISINAEYEVEDMYFGWYNYEIAVDDRTVLLTDCDYGGEATVVYANGSYYLYFEEKLEGGAELLTYIDLDTLQYSENDRRYGSLERVDYESYSYTDEGTNSVRAVYPLVNPSSFYIMERMDALGTYSGFKEYSVDEKGRPETEERRFEALSEYALKTKSPLKADMVDEEGNIVGVYTIPEGTYLMIAYTDNESFVDVQMIEAGAVEQLGEAPYELYQINDGVRPSASKETYRIYVDVRQYPATLDGVDESEVFGGIFYAG